MSDCSTNEPDCEGKFVRLDEHARGPAGTAGPPPDGWFPEHGVDIIYSIIASDGVVFDISV